jgi:Effector-associated domain 2/Caspase domain/Golgi phosphoprotein 3 (GPP34)
VDERRYRALLVGNWHYPEDPAGLQDLKGPLNDVSRLAAVLSDPQSGLFASADIMAIAERPSYEITVFVDTFLKESSPDDVVFLYYSGYCLTDDAGTLLLCGRNSRTDLKRSTTVVADELSALVTACPAAVKLVVFDCRNLGDRTARDLVGQLGGENRHVILSCRRRDQVSAESHLAGLSEFTGHLINGLRGAAASDGTNYVTVSSLWQYLQRQAGDESDAIASNLSGAGALAISRAAPTQREGGRPRSTLTVSESRIDIDGVRPGEVLPVQRVYVTARTLAGYPAAWAPRTDADWVGLGTYPDRLEITLQPRSGWANVEVRNQETGEVCVIRISVHMAQHSPTNLAGNGRRSNPSVYPGTIDTWHDLTADEWRQLIDGFLNLSGMRDNDLRSMYVRELEAKIGRSLQLQRYSDARHDVWSIVSACLERPGTLRSLAEMLRVLHSDSEAARELGRIVDELDPPLDRGPGRVRRDRPHQRALADDYYFLGTDERGNPIKGRPTFGVGLSAALIGESLLRGELDLIDGVVLARGTDPREDLSRFVSEKAREIPPPCRAVDLILELRLEVAARVAARLADQRLLVRRAVKRIRTSIHHIPVDQIAASEGGIRLGKYLMDAARRPDEQTAMLGQLAARTGLLSTLPFEISRDLARDGLARMLDSLSPPLRTIVDATDQAIALIAAAPIHR